MNTHTFKGVSKFIYSDMNTPEKNVKVPQESQRDNKDPENSIPQNQTLSPLETSPKQATDYKSPHSQLEDFILPSQIPKDSVAFSNPEIVSPSTDSLSFSSLSPAPSTHPTSADEEILKKIKINEFKKNINLPNRIKDRSKTIIEVHMEVLEECRNEEWENNKEEFLEICIDELVQKDYKKCANLTDDHLITENIENTNDIKNLNILWNKWIEKHRNISKILKKEHWFHNLKNE
ncbi:STP1 protein [Plasmodium malariae]|uniref:STP1 protein n=1 Tax=Plasmodium malariae TaxID=5858 RepID=A0A1A8X2L4_PLAMA|nr:STP1 protein [Plasmodium malariae]